MKVAVRSSLAVFLLVFFTSCAQLGIPKPETFNQRTAIAYATVTQVRVTATQLVTAKKITADDAMNVQTSADIARAGIDTARKIHETDATAGSNRINAIITGLNALAIYLASRGGT